MKVLVVGRGNHQETVEDVHTLDFVDSAMVDGKIRSLVGYDFVFLHVGSEQEEARYVLDTWISEGFGSRIIIFGAPANLNQCRVSGLPSLTGMFGWKCFVGLRWDRVPASFSGDARTLVKLLQHRNFRVLPALLLLCHGYLAAHADPTTGKPALSPEHPDYEECQRALSRWTKAGGSARLAGELGLGSKEVTIPEDWWQIFEGIDNLRARTEEEWNTGVIQTNPRQRFVFDLVESITSITGGSRIDIGTVAKAYNAIDYKLNPEQRTGPRQVVQND